MKVALILPGSIWYAPYVRIYTRLLDEIKADYSIISWNRDGKDIQEGYQYNYRNTRGHGAASFSEYRGYIKFIKKTIKDQGFDKIIVFGPQMTCLLGTYLLIHFRGRYMIDYRDLSVEQKRGFKQLFTLMLKFSRVNVISSPGFKKYLPKNNYVLSHNFDKNIVKDAISQKGETSFNIKDIIDILTIGAIRDFESNWELIQTMANKKEIIMRFVGRGDTALYIEDLCKKDNIQNVKFIGYYPKEDEPKYIKNSDYLNIYYPRKASHDTALSNRFYNSLIYKKPMIVTKNTIQGDYAEKYQVGIAISNCGHLDVKLKEFLRTDFNSYAKRCNELLTSFLDDQNIFEVAIKSFVGE